MAIHFTRQYTRLASSTKGPTSLSLLPPHPQKALVRPCFLLPPSLSPLFLRSDPLPPQKALLHRPFSYLIPGSSPPPHSAMKIRKIAAAEEGEKSHQLNLEVGGKIRWTDRYVSISMHFRCFLGCGSSNYFTILYNFFYWI